MQAYFKLDSLFTQLLLPLIATVNVQKGGDCCVCETGPVAVLAWHRIVKAKFSALAFAAPARVDLARTAVIAKTATVVNSLNLAAALATRTRRRTPIANRELQSIVTF